MGLLAAPHRGPQLSQERRMHPELFKIPLINFTVPGYGAMIVLAFLGGTWWMCHRASKVKADPDICLSLSLICLMLGWLGGRTFYVIHYWKTQFAFQPGKILDLQAGGFEVYGGLITAAVFCLLYLWIKGVSLRLYADIAAPTVVFGLGVGRIGCFLVGCCWGAPCPAHLPWAVQFPALSSAHQQQWEQRTATLPAELIFVDPTGLGAPIPPQILKMSDAELERVREKVTHADKAIAEAKARGDVPKVAQMVAAKRGALAVFDHLDKWDTTTTKLRALASSERFRSNPVHPAQIYSAIGPLLLALILNAYFYRRTRHGTVMAAAIICYAVERFIEEIIRIDNPQDTFGLTISQGVSVGFLLFGLLWLAILQKLPLRSSAPAKRTPAAQPAAAPTA
jgi:phosphatidylglycerol---prolipoprotein diacylglyceryl transferase